MKHFFQITIPKRSSQCFIDQHPFKSGQEIYSLLIEDKESSFIRQDYCLECLVPVSEQKAVLWKARIPVKEAAAKPISPSDERALILFLSLISGVEK